MSQTKPLGTRCRSWADVLKGRLTVRDWTWWQLPPLLRSYVAVVVLAALVVIAVTSSRTGWRQADLVKFFLLTACGAVSVLSVARSAYRKPGGGIAVDFAPVWVLPVAVLLPPVYAAAASAVLITISYFFVGRGVLHRRVFTGATVLLGYVLAGGVFRLFPASFAGPAPGSGSHTFTWAVAVAACELLGCRVQYCLVIGAVKMSDPRVRIWPRELSLGHLLQVLVETDLAVLITVLVGLSPRFVVIALPTVLLARRYLAHPVLVAQSRVDGKTGLLNISTWKAEAEAELIRAIHGGRPLALVLIDIDRFKLVNDTYGHLAGDRVLKAVADALTQQSRGCDRPGRFGGEEYVLLLVQTGEQHACKIAERLRGYIAALQIPADDRPDARALKVTVSAGVTALEAGSACELADLLAAADSAMYGAKRAGRNQVAFASPLPHLGLHAAPGSAHGSTASPGRGDADDSPPPSGHQVVLLKSDPTTSLRSRALEAVQPRASRGCVLGLKSLG